MDERYSNKYRKEVKVIYAGEYYTSHKDELIETVLGSCVAVCLYDTVRKVSGMNHFMLPGKIVKRDIFSDESAKYGVIAINHLIKSMLDKGAEHKNMIAKIFGGGQVLKTVADVYKIHLDNIRLARVVLEMEDIHIDQSDVGDQFTRKIIMDVKTGKVYLRKSKGKYQEKK
jgi:chemotaxis protein CheD